MKPEQALNILAGQCSKKEICSKDARQKLIKWEIQEEDIKKIMSFLFEHKFIDDERFARIYTEDKFHFNHWGKQKITMMLRQKGISQDIIDEALSIIPTDNYTEHCMELLQQKYRTLTEQDPYKLKAKLTRFAVGRGFDYDTVSKCLFQLLSD